MAEPSCEPVFKKPNSWVSQNFKRLPPKRIQCLKCSTTYSEGTSTTRLKKHVKETHTGSKSIEDLLSTSRVTRTFQDYLREFIVVGQHEFSIVDEEPFQNLLRKLKPDVEIPSRRTLVTSIHSWYQADISRIRVRLENVHSKISLTTDLWTGMNSKPYIGITAHFVNEKWVLERILLAFEYVPYPHTGQELSKVLEKVLNGYKIETKVMAVVTDNASNNITMMASFNAFSTHSETSGTHSDQPLTHSGASATHSGHLSTHSEYILLLSYRFRLQVYRVSPSCPKLAKS
ncbi:putative AC transposase [Halotydeus destructor]|nr:putative AC transposase [Halotydeus destructor]